MRPPSQAQLDSEIATIHHALVEMEIAPGDVVREELWRKAVDGLEKLLDAVVSVRVPSVTPEEKALGPYTYRTQPNPKAVVPAAKILLETRFGKPRQQVQHSGQVGHIHATQVDLLRQADHLFIDRAGSVLDRFALIQRAEPVAQDEKPQPAEKQEVVEI